MSSFLLRACAIRRWALPNVRNVTRQTPTVTPAGTSGPPNNVSTCIASKQIPKRVASKGRSARTGHRYTLCNATIMPSIRPRVKLAFYLREGRRVSRSGTMSHIFLRQLQTPASSKKSNSEPGVTRVLSIVGMHGHTYARWPRSRHQSRGAASPMLRRGSAQELSQHASQKTYIVTKCLCLLTAVVKPLRSRAAPVDAYQAAVYILSHGGTQ